MATRPRSRRSPARSGKRSLAIALDEVAGKVPLIAGIYSDGTLEAVELARDARAAGAAGLLVFPPTLVHVGRAGQARHGAAPLPDPRGRGGPAARRLRVPARLRHRLQPGDPRRALQDPHGRRRSRTGPTRSWATRRTCGRCGPAGGRRGHVVVHDVADGELHARRRRLHLGDGQRRPPTCRPRCSRRCRPAASTRRAGSTTALAPLVNVFYAPPFVDMHNRMKEALAILGRIPAAHVRPPLTPVSEDERHRIRLALRALRPLLLATFGLASQGLASGSGPRAIPVGPPCKCTLARRRAFTV